MPPRRGLNDESAPSDRRRRVVIVGAGASGLYCAHLLQHDYEVVVLEARDRIGGRIHSVQHCVPEVDPSNRKNIVIDHGAAWVHGTGYEWGKQDDHDVIAAVPEPNPMMELLVESKDKVDLYENHLRPVCMRGNPWIRPKHVLHDADEIVLYVAGRRLEPKDPIIERAIDRHFEVMDRVSDSGNECYRMGRGMDAVHTSLEETMQSVKSEYPVPNKDEDAHVVEALTNFYLYVMECWYGGQASEMQLSEFTSDEDSIDQDEEYREQGDFYGPHCTLRDGMKTVLEPLLKDGGVERVQCDQEVVRIQHDAANETVLVETKTGLVVEADCCVVTIPISCLQEATNGKSLFQPALPETKQEAIHAIRMGKYKKVLLSFDRIFWPRDEVMLGMVRSLHSSCSNQLGNELLFDNLWARDGIACIEAILTGTGAVWATGRDTDEIRNAVLDFMKDAMGLNGDDLREWCTECHVTRWEEDPFSKGAFSCYTLGTLERHTQALQASEWNGKLVFAGEATIAEYEGSVHAALFSARNAAESVTRYLEGDCTH